MVFSPLTSGKCKQELWLSWYGTASQPRGRSQEEAGPHVGWWTGEGHPGSRQPERGEVNLSY